MADDEGLSDYELGRRDALEEARRSAAGGRMTYEDFRVLEKRDPARAVRVLADGGVILPDYIQEALGANREEAARQLGNSFDPASPIPASEYAQALAERARRDSGFPGGSGEAA